MAQKKGVIARTIGHELDVVETALGTSAEARKGSKLIALGKPSGPITQRRKKARRRVMTTLGQDETLGN